MFVYNFKFQRRENKKQRIRRETLIEVEGLSENSFPPFLCVKIAKKIL